MNVRQLLTATVAGLVGVLMAPIPTVASAGGTARISGVKTHSTRHFYEVQGVGCVTARRCELVGTGAPSGDGAVALLSGHKVKKSHRVRGTDMLDAVACPAVNRCIAVGVRPHSPHALGVVTLIKHGRPGHKHVVKVAAGLEAVACVSARTCYAVGDTEQNEGSFVTITGGKPQGAELVAGSTYLDGIACPTSTSCEAVGGSGSGTFGTHQAVYVPIDGGSPGPAQPVAAGSQSSALRGITCVSTSRCLATLITSTTNHTKASVLPIDDGQPGTAISLPRGSKKRPDIDSASIACTSGSRCVIAGEADNDSSSKSIGFVITYSGSAFGHYQYLHGTQAVDAVSCSPTSRHCVAVGETAEDHGTITRFKLP